MNYTQKGFTLIEIMLVLVIIAAIIGMIGSYTLLKTSQMIRDRAAMQMQQILNAGLSYYINNGAWPGYSSSSGSCSTTAINSSGLNGTYLPTMNNPYFGQPGYTITCTTSGVLFAATVTTSNSTEATVLAGMLPLAVTSGSSVTAYVNIPGQNLNNARSVNLAGIYHPGACVPVPTCPGASGAMVPRIYVATTQIVGDNIPSSSNLYPITSFTAYATGTGTDANPPGCPPSTDTNCYSDSTNGSGTSFTLLPSSATQFYWRVCVDVSTTSGDLQTSTGTGSASWGQYQSLLAVTRCVPTNANEGATMNVWQP